MFNSKNGQIASLQERVNLLEAHLVGTSVVMSQTIEGIYSLATDLEVVVAELRILAKTVEGRQHNIDLLED